MNMWSFQAEQALDIYFFSISILLTWSEVIAINPSFKVSH